MCFLHEDDDLNSDNYFSCMKIFEDLAEMNSQHNNVVS